MYNESCRGVGIQFGAKALEDFLNTLHMKQMIRAHQCVQSGVSRFGGDLLIAVFSCSRYESHDNRCGMIFVGREGRVQMFSLPPLDRVPRAQVNVELAPFSEGAAEVESNGSIAVDSKVGERYRCAAERSKSSGKMTRPPAERCLRVRAQDRRRIPGVVSLPVIVPTDS
jgi:hypothetical protein